MIRGYVPSPLDNYYYSRFIQKVKRDFEILIDKVLTIARAIGGAFAYYSPARAPQADGRMSRGYNAVRLPRFF